MNEQEQQSENILTKVRVRVEECFKKAEEYYGQAIPRCEVKFDLTGTKGGTTHYAKRLLRFNRKLLLENQQEYFETVIPHEVSHCVCRWKFGYAGIMSHGKEWKAIMINIFRLPPKRCHKMDTTNVKRKTKEYKYCCPACHKEFSFGLIRHKRALKGQRYYCPRHHLELTFEGKGPQIVAQTLKSEELY